MMKASMQDLDSAVLRAATQLSVLSSRMVRLLENLNQQLTIDQQIILTNAEVCSIVDAELVSARELQKQLVAGHFALVRSLLRKQRRQWMMTITGSEDLGIRQNGRGSWKARGVSVETSQAQGANSQESDGHSFTERQREIIQLVALGYDNRQIGQSLCIAEQTVKNHLHAIFERAGVSKRSDLAIRAYNGEDAATKSLVSSDFPATSAQADRVKGSAAGN